MKALLLFILLLCQLTTVNGQQTGCRIPVTLLSLDLGLSSTQTAQSSQPIAQGEKDTVVSSPLSVDYHINQINLADSLYKNYLPQYNYDEVKAAVEFFEKLRTLESENLRNVDNSTSQVLKFSDSQVLYQCARAHYYHAVGLTERDDIVGACEHYLLALEIMLEDETLAEMYGRASKGKSLKTKGRKSQGSQPIAQGTEEYEKTRFMALIYTRLGRLFYNEAYCDLSIQKYEKALRYIEILGDTIAKANVLKELGNTYQLSGNYDSALYYYNESLKANSNISNKLDVEKSIAHILFDKGERDSAYRIVKNNLDYVNSIKIKYSYHYTLGNMYCADEKYDSAIYYLEESLDDSIIATKLSFTTLLAAVYDSLGDKYKKAYYDDLSSAMFFDNINKNNEKSRLQTIYDGYKERINNRKYELKNARNRKTVIVSCVFIAIVITLLLLIINQKHKKQTEDLNNIIADNQFRHSLLDGKIQKMNQRLRKKEETIKEMEDELAEAKQKIEGMDNISNIETYYKSDICQRIVNRKATDFEKLNHKELALLLQAADKHLNNLTKRLKNKYPKLDKEDMYYICLVLLNTDENSLQYLLDRNRKTVWYRLNKIKTILELEHKEDIFICLTNDFIN